MAAPGGGEGPAAGPAADGVLWAEARALLPGAEEGLTLALSGEVEDCILPLLRRARGLLYGAAGRPGPAAAAALRRLGDVLRDYSWEKLNAGPWREVSKAWRQVYAYGCLFGALAEVAAGRPLAPAVRLCDMGLLMGASVMDNVLARLVRVLQARLPRGKRRAAAEGSAKVPPAALRRPGPRGPPRPPCPGGPAPAGSPRTPPSPPVLPPSSRSPAAGGPPGCAPTTPSPVSLTTAAPGPAFSLVPPFPSGSARPGGGGGAAAGAFASSCGRRMSVFQRVRIDPPPVPDVQPEDELPHLHCPSLEHFRDNYLIPQKPVVLEGIMDHWQCMKKWR